MSVMSDIYNFNVESLYNNIAEDECYYHRLGSLMKLSMKIKVSTDCGILSVYMPSKLTRDEKSPMFALAKLNNEFPLKVLIDGSVVSFHQESSKYEFKKNDVIELMGEIPIKEWQPANPFKGYCNSDNDYFLSYVKGVLNGISSVIVTTSKIDECPVCQSSKRMIDNLIVELKKRIPT